jgi:hypothetical protein
MQGNTPALYLPMKPRTLSVKGVLSSLEGRVRHEISEVLGGYVVNLWKDFVDTVLSLIKEKGI